MLRENNDHVIFGLNDQEYKNNNYKKRNDCFKQIQLCLILSVSGMDPLSSPWCRVLEQNDCFLKLSASGDFFDSVSI